MKDKLQAELLEKIKPGTKPSDLKKQRKIIKPQPPKDEGYESDSSNKSVPTPPPLPNQQIKELQNQITSLQKQLQLYKDFREADIKIKEELKKQLATKDKTISQLKANIERLQDQNTTLSKIIAELQQKNSELTKIIETMKSKQIIKRNYYE